jgi:hypothetical protein
MKNALKTRTKFLKIKISEIDNTPNGENKQRHVEFVKR